jgi:hypothetical protein
LCMIVPPSSGLHSFAEASAHKLTTFSFRPYGSSGRRIQRKYHSNRLDPLFLPVVTVMIQAPDIHAGNIQPVVQSQPFPGSQVTIGLHPRFLMPTCSLPSACASRRVSRPLATPRSILFSCCHSLLLTRGSYVEPAHAIPAPITSKIPAIIAKTILFFITIPPVGFMGSFLQSALLTLLFLSTREFLRG